MAKELVTSIIIDATPKQVWAVLTDFEKYPDWNPFIKSLTGQVAVGNTIVARLLPPGGQGMTFKPKVLVFEQESAFRWLGHLLFPGLFDGEHIFELTDNGDGTTLFVQREKFKGILVPLFQKMLDTNTLNGFKEMNMALKTRVEGR